MGSPMSPLIANIFMEEFEVKALSSTPHPYPLAKVCWWHLCHQQGRTQSGNTTTYQQPRPTHPVHCGTHTTRLTSIPRHPDHHWTRQHLQHQSLQETHPYRSILTLGQRPPHHSQTKWLQHISSQGQGSVIFTGQTGPRTTTHQDSFTTLPVPQLGPQPMASQVHQPKSTYQPQQHQQHQPTGQPPQQKRNITIVVPYMPKIGEKLRKLCKNKGIQVHYKGTNTLRTLLGNPKDKAPKNNQKGIIYHYKCPQINCPSAYIGESGRSLGEGVKEHFKAPSPSTYMAPLQDIPWTQNNST